MLKKKQWYGSSIWRWTFEVITLISSKMKFLSLDKRQVANFDFGKDQGQRIKSSRHLDLVPLFESLTWEKYFTDGNIIISSHLCINLSLKGVIVITVNLPTYTGTGSSKKPWLPLRLRWKKFKAAEKKLNVPTANVVQMI